MPSAPIDPKTIRFGRTFIRDASDKLLCECAELFSRHYGRWSPTHPTMPGKPIRMSAERLRSYLPGDNAWIATARSEDGVLIGYALAALFAHRAGPISWVTQLVVHKEYRQNLVGSTMLNSIWGISNHFAWGIASANPYAIRALEKATRRRCGTGAIIRSRKAIESVLQRIPYLRDRPFTLSSHVSIVNTDFRQDLSGVPKITPWALGCISEGEEWLAVTFRDQEKLAWSSTELQRFMDMSGAIQREAYDRMNTANPQSHHVWAKPEHAEKEIDFLLGKINPTPDARILDFGCGGGRHSLALAKRGYYVTGVDFSRTIIDVARKAAEVENEHVRKRVNFIEDDCRAVELNDCFDIGLCLYDVIGSFPDEESNIQILKKVAKHVKPGGRVIFSVMSFDFMWQKAKHICDSTNIQKKLDDIQASDTMQKTGEIFHEDYVLIDKETHVFYRKETFDAGNSLPTELIVRDRRYTIDEMKKMCDSVGLTIDVCGFVKAGDFSIVAQCDQGAKKEILVIARKGLL